MLVRRMGKYLAAEPRFPARNRRGVTSDDGRGPLARPGRRAGGPALCADQGRTAAGGGATFGLIDVVIATSDRPRSTSGPGPSTGGSWACAAAHPFVDLAAEIDLPLGVVRVLLGDLGSGAWSRSPSTQKQPSNEQAAEECA